MNRIASSGKQKPDSKSILNRSPFNFCNYHRHWQVVHSVNIDNTGIQGLRLQFLDEPRDCIIGAMNTDSRIKGDGNLFGWIGCPELVIEWSLPRGLLRSGLGQPWQAGDVISLKLWFKETKEILLSGVHERTRTTASTNAGYYSTWNITRGFNFVLFLPPELSVKLLPPAPANK